MICVPCFMLQLCEAKTVALLAQLGPVTELDPSQLESLIKPIMQAEARVHTEANEEALRKKKWNEEWPVLEAKPRQLGVRKEGGTTGAHHSGGGGRRACGRGPGRPACRVCVCVCLCLCSQTGSVTFAK